MRCEVQNIYKNIRYRILSINGVNYLIDLETPFWVTLCPIIYWFIPHTIYRVEDERFIEQIKFKQIKKVGMSATGLGGAAFLLANSSNLIIDYFNLKTSIMANVIILLLTVLLFILFRVYLSRANRQKVTTHIVMDDLSKEKIFIRPTSLTYIFKSFSVYILFLVLSILMGAIFIIEGEGNTIYLFSFTIMFSAFLITSAISVAAIEKFKVKFIR